MIKQKRVSEESKVDIVGEKNQVKQKMQEREGKEKERKPSEVQWRRQKGQKEINEGNRNILVKLILFL